MPGSVQKETCGFLQEGWLQTCKQGSVRSIQLHVMSLMRAREGFLGSSLTTAPVQSDAALGIFSFVFQAGQSLGHLSSLCTLIICPSQPFLLIFQDYYTVCEMGGTTTCCTKGTRESMKLGEKEQVTSISLWIWLAFI